MGGGGNGGTGSGAGGGGGGGGLLRNADEVSVVCFIWKNIRMQPFQ